MALRANSVATYKTGEEVLAALTTLNVELQEVFRWSNDTTKGFYAAVPDVTAPDAEEKRQAYRSSIVEEYKTKSSTFNDKLLVEFDNIRKSAIELPGNDPKLDQVRYVINQNFITLVDLTRESLNNTADANKDLRDRIIKAKSEAASATPASPAAAAAPIAASATNTATNQVVSTTPSAVPSTSASPSAPAPSGPENQLSTTQRINLIKSKTGSGEPSSAPSATKSEADSADTAAVKSAVANSVDFDINVTKKYRPNPLHNYPSYTYSLSLHLISPEDFNQMVETGEYTAKNVLVSSAGRYNTLDNGTKSFKRNPEFSDDFYFEDLNLTTIIGMGERNRATNAIDMSFTLIEPYGLTFLDRLLAASKALGIDNYLQNPYMLQIDFYGADDQGQMLSPIPNITKNIPIRMLSCKASVDTGGSKYQIQAQPYNHQAFDNIVASTPISVEVVAETVEGFFTSSLSGALDLAQSMDKNKQERSEYNKYIQDVQQRATMNNMVVPLTATSDRYTKDPVYKTRSYADVLNAYCNQLEFRKKQIFVDRYEFKFDKEIGTARLIDDINISPSDRPMNDIKETFADVLRGSTGMDVNSFSREIKTAINYGSSVEAVISRVIRNSSYIREQLAVLENTLDIEKYKTKKEAIENAELKWFKIVPSVRLIGFDPFTNLFAREITYHIVPYIVKNVRHDDAPKKKATKLDASKEYYYIYTGQNDDVIDLKIDFNAVYYTAITAYRTTNISISGIDADYINTGLSCDVTAPKLNTNTIQPTHKRYLLADQRDISASRAKTAVEVSAADLERSITNEATADNLSVDLTILGDPDFIKQDDLFYKPKLDEKGYVIREFENPITPNGSIKTDQGEVYAYLRIQTPTDVDDNTGMMKFGEKMRTSGFSGIYRVYSVSNSFSKGKFTQVLTLIRQPEQDDVDNKQAEAAKERVAHWTSDPQDPTDAPSVPEVPADSTSNDDQIDNTGGTNPEPPPEELPPLVQDDNANDYAMIREQGETSAITNQTEPQQVAPGNLTFGQAFREARAAFGGPGGEFYWQGKAYQTNVKGEAFVDNPTQVFK